MPTTWQLQNAKNRFSELVDRALTDGPQIVSRRGKNVAVVLSFETYAQQLRQREPLVSFLRRPAFRALGKVLDRPPAADRATDL
jgi:prevent-host-death family protein